MRRVGAAAAAVARDEVGRFIAHGRSAGRHQLSCIRGACRSRALGCLATSEYGRAPLATRIPSSWIAARPGRFRRGGDMRPCPTVALAALAMSRACENGLGDVPMGLARQL